MIDDLRLLDKSNENRIEYIMASILQHLRKYNQLQGLFCANAEIAQIAYYAVIQMKRTPGVDFEIVSFDPPYLPGVHFIQQDYRTMVQHAIDLLFAPVSYTHLDVYKRQRQCIADQIPEIICIEKSFKMLQPSPRAPGNSLAWRKILKGYLHPVHGAVAENNKIDQCRKKKNIKLPVGNDTPEFNRPASLPASPSSFRRSFSFHML